MDNNTLLMIVLAGISIISVLACIGILIACLLNFRATEKLYTEYFKERAISGRNQVGGNK